MKEGKWEESQLPGIQSHSSPCRSLVVLGRRALSVRSSLLLCLKTKQNKKVGILKYSTSMYKKKISTRAEVTIQLNGEDLRKGSAFWKYTYSFSFQDFHEKSDTTFTPRNYVYTQSRGNC